LVIPMINFNLLGTGLLYGALMFSIISAGQYLWEFWQALVNKELLE